MKVSAALTMKVNTQIVAGSIVCRTEGGTGMAAAWTARGRSAVGSPHCAGLRWCGVGQQRPARAPLAIPPHH